MRVSVYMCMFFFLLSIPRMPKARYRFQSPTVSIHWFHSSIFFYQDSSIKNQKWKLCCALDMKNTRNIFSEIYYYSKYKYQQWESNKIFFFIQCTIYRLIDDIWNERRAPFLFPVLHTIDTGSMHLQYVIFSLEHWTWELT